MTKVAFLGTGIMGAPMAANVAQAGLDVTVWNRTRSKAEAVEGATVADSAVAAVDGADLVVTMVSDGDAVEAIADEALDSFGDEAVWLQMSTVGIEATERLLARASERGIPYVDAPVSGTKQPAEQGVLVVLASGPGEAVERGRPVFDAVGAKTVELGEQVGAATRLKLVLNSWIVAQMEALAETLAFAEGIDIDPKLFLETIDGGPLNSAYAQMKGKAMIERSFPAAFPLSLARKDTGLVRDAAARHGLSLPLPEVIERQQSVAIEKGHGDEDMSAVFLASVDA